MIGLNKLFRGEFSVSVIHMTVRQPALRGVQSVVWLVRGCLSLIESMAGAVQPESGQCRSFAMDPS